MRQVLKSHLTKHTIFGVMRTYNEIELIEALQSLQIVEGDVLYVSSSLFELGTLKGVFDKTELCQRVLEAICSVIGNAGTVVVPTFSPSVGRLGTAFELETTPSETGIFSEFIRTHPSSIRSLHPLHSVAALGRKAEEICLNVSNNSYAIGSPLYRMFAMNAKAVALGAARPLTGWVHLLEFLSGVPYIYNKLLDIEVYEKKIKIQKEFYAPVRYLDFDITYDIVNAERLIANTGIFKFSPLGRGNIVWYAPLTILIKDAN